MSPRIPSGRAGRLELLRRIDVADRAAGLLERKVRILREEEQRLVLLTDASRRAWRHAAAEADTWALRAGLLGGQRPLLLAAGDTAGRAVVRVRWRASMGVEYPDEVSLDLPPPSARLAALGSAALSVAAGAHRAALTAAVRYAAAESALGRIREELTATRRRLRGITERLSPRLRDELSRVELRLDEMEREEGIRLRWAHPDGAR